MKSTQLIGSTLVTILIFACHQPDPSSFDKYFVNKTLRIDYFHTGDAERETVRLDKMYLYDSWAGSMTNLIDSLNYGAYYHKIYDEATGELIYSRGFDSFFKEYQTSAPAMEGEEKQFHESAIVPMPTQPIVFALEKREKDGTMREVFRQTVDPADAEVTVQDPEVRVFTSQDNGDPHVRADIAIIAEGYTAGEVGKFEADLKRFTEIFFRAEPCRSERHLFNIRGVFKPSLDSGIDEPRAGIDKQTAVNASFNTLGSERYVLTEDNKSLRDIAGHAPYDALYIMVNHKRYGGGGIYNFYCVYTSDNMNSDYLMVHEFGHSFFGLADEYYTSSTAYNDFYPAGYEPVEPNITALQDADNIKWKELLTDTISIPTPWPKHTYDSIDLAWQARRTAINDSIFALQKAGADPAAVEHARAYYDTLSARRNREVQDYLENSGYAGTVGAFEGAGYASTGLYRPSINCIMFTRTDYFCPVCQEAMRKVIDSYAR